MKKERINELRDFYYDHLMNNVIPYWMQSDLIDEENGGFITSVDREGKSFKCDVAGNDKHYGFNVVTDSSEVVVFEAAIDLMSYVDIYNDYEANKLALGMVSDAPLETFLKEHPNITDITFCLDNDKAGRDATESLMQKYRDRGYEVRDNPAPEEYKDFNEWLVTAKNAGMFMSFPRHQNQKHR